MSHTQGNDLVSPEPLATADTANPPDPATIDIDEIKEKLAAIEHERWADWQRWCHEVIRTQAGIIPSVEAVLKRWDKQIATEYKYLSPSEKASDMEQVDRYWPLITALITEKENRAREDQIMLDELSILVEFDIDEAKLIEWRQDQLATLKSKGKTK